MTHERLALLMLDTFVFGSRTSQNEEFSLIRRAYKISMTAITLSLCMWLHVQVLIFSVRWTPLPDQFILNHS